MASALLGTPQVQPAKDVIAVGGTRNRTPFRMLDVVKANRGEELAPASASPLVLIPGMNWYGFPVWIPIPIPELDRDTIGC